MSTVPSSSVPRARDSAAVVLIRGHGPHLEAYWVKRSDAVTYMPGFRAFVGGTLSRDDEALPVQGAPEGPERAMRACALREVFEEAGILVGVADPGEPERVARARTRLLANEARFSELAREHGWTFRADDLPAIGRWVTPAFAVRRFDTWFFLARVPEGQEPSIRVGELAEGEWVKPAEALRRWRLGLDAFAAPILYNLVALAEGDGGLLERMRSAPERSGQPVRRIELKWGIVLHPVRTRPLPPSTHTNAYLVGEREMALVDPGSDDPAELERLFALVELLQSEGRRLRVVLLTHHHPDHTGGLEAVRSRYPVRVAAHAETGKHVRIDVALRDGEHVPLLPGPAGDWNLRAIHTPGHARGHLCFLHERTRSLLSGDHVIGAPGTVIVDPPEGDMAAYMKSLERLLDVPAETLFPGHGSPQGAAHRRVQALLDHRRQREHKVMGALRAEAQDLAALLAHAYDDTPKDLWRYAERSLLAHLLKLEAEGRAVRGGDRWSRADV
jgi:glyoxylase-like metal-dependent hydrolase (beta-lactamase superfamily II)/8-oxo-dGTP pyrophosphatase MutT (NUDIX family)